jgi:hypothetical protein
VSLDGYEEVKDESNKGARTKGGYTQMDDSIHTPFRYLVQSVPSPGRPQFDTETPTISNANAAVRPSLEIREDPSRASIQESNSLSPAYSPATLGHWSAEMESTPVDRWPSPTRPGMTFHKNSYCLKAWEVLEDLHPWHHHSEAIGRVSQTSPS